MEINLNCCENGQPCRNVDAIKKYGATMDEREASRQGLSWIDVHEGSIVCRGSGRRGACGAKLDESSYALTDGVIRLDPVYFRPTSCDDSQLAARIAEVVPGFKRGPSEESPAARAGRLLFGVAEGVAHTISDNMLHTS